MPTFDDHAIVDALGGRPPATFDRAGRVRLIGEVAKALLNGTEPDRGAALFVGGALLAWLERGGRLERDYFQVIKPHSRHTPRVLWKLMRDERQRDVGAVTILPSSTER